MASTRLTEVGCATSRAWQPVDEAITAGSLECHLSFVAGSGRNVGSHDLGFQGLVKVRRMCECLALRPEAGTELVVLLLECGLLCLHGFRKESAT
jgi:hypothetical protein